MKKIFQMIIVIVFFLPNFAFALSTDKQQIAYIAADSATLNHKTGVCTYRGHVKLTQGSTTILADTLITHSLDVHSQLDQATALGNLATYSTLPDNTSLLFIAKAQTINYYPKKGMVKLVGLASASQGSDSFSGPVINYDVKDQVVTTPASKEGRTTIIIQPGQKINLPNQ